jgi:hypothetical protein
MKTAHITGLVFALLLAGCSSLGLRRSGEAIEASLLKLTPMGSSPEAVLAIAKKKGWQRVRFNPDRGFLKQVGADRQYPIIGVSSIEASLGDYWFFPIGTTNATAFWGFDKDRRLVKVWVWKTTDAL